MHYDRNANKSIGSGKLSFLAREHLQSRVKGRIVLLGMESNNNEVAGCMNV